MSLSVFGAKRFPFTTPIPDCKESENEFMACAKCNKVLEQEINTLKEQKNEQMIFLKGMTIETAEAAQQNNKNFKQQYICLQY
jgi:hypothetical protein